MKLPPLPPEWINPKENPEKIIIYWETHAEHLIFFKEFIREIILNDLEYFLIAWDRRLQPDYDNGWTRIWIVACILQDYKDLIINEMQLPKDLINITELFDFLEKKHPGRDICRSEVSLRKQISRTYEKLRRFYFNRGVLL